MINPVQLAGCLAVILFVVIGLVNARGLTCAICLRKWAIYSDGRDNRCKRHRARRMRL